MKLLYINNMEFTKLNFIGVYKKILNQIECFKLHNIDVYLINNEHVINGLLSKILSRVPFFTKYKYNKIFKNFNLDVYYFRYNHSSWNSIHFIKKIKKRNKNVKILIEIPTYPYDGERKSLKMIPINIKDKISRKKLYKYVDRIITFSNDKTIFNIPTIKIINGINIKEILPRDKIETQVISLIAVASLSWWHGYDRLIKGLGEYYKKNGKREIILHMVGDGKISSEYKKLANEYNLNDVVVFYGNKQGEELDEIYDKANLAIESLGRHRSGNNLSSSLKTREYIAKGLPVIGSCKVDIFDNEYKYYLELPADETPVDIEKVIEFYDKIYPNEETFQKINDEIRTFAEKTVDMSITMKSVIDYLKGNKM